ncbi:hypothetical protein GCM10010106_22350 [Thermopolyspora flexuosa]|jgi:hypothetical protein|uniref:Uncharacterized protein n=2 Tax=Thermopolyspora flexuosa TaxID=103836 RepID=A0A543J2Y3_9ACTN|nr:hypothetical protein FHX40_3947 [Thermopolyspora flexuosa]GGM75387.1 hypothetical protein GCM10010106_22350 [Thermopolyspora flexuosa]
MGSPDRANASAQAARPAAAARPRARILPPVRLPCSWCDAEFGVADFLDRCRFYWRDARSVRWDCPRCGRWEDIDLHPGEVRRGYVYWAGDSRFAHMRTAIVPGLLPYSGEDGLTVEYGGRVWRVPDLGSSR